MDSTSKTSADDIINQFDRSCSCSTLSDTTFGVSNGCCAKDIVEKLMVQLKQKDKQYKEDIKKLFMAYDCEKARANEASAAMVEIANEFHTLPDAIFASDVWDEEEDILDKFVVKLQEKEKQLEEKKQANEELVANLNLEKVRAVEATSAGTDEFSKTKYLQIQTSSGTSTTSASVMFCANVDNKSKFAPIFHPQQNKQQPEPGILVDIYSLANGCFLSTEVDMQNRLVSNRNRSSAEVNNQNRLVVVANSPIAPANKFLILAADVA